MRYIVKSGSVRAAVNGKTPQDAAKEFIKNERRNENLNPHLTIVSNNADDSMCGFIFNTKQLLDDTEEDESPKLTLVTGDD